MPTSEVRDPCISRPIHPAGESAVWRVGRSPFKGEDRNREPLTAGSSFPVSILSFPLLTIPIARTPAQATMLSPAESIAALLICLLALFPCHRPFSKQQSEGSFVRGHIMSCFSSESFTVIHRKGQGPRTGLQSPCSLCIPASILFLLLTPLQPHVPPCRV